MGSFDCYCALCSGPLGIGNVRFGMRSKKALKKRRKRVEVHKRRLAGENVNEDDIESNHDEEMDDAPDDVEVQKPDENAEQGEISEDDEDDEEDSDFEPSSSDEDSDDESIDDMESDLPVGRIEDVSIPPVTPEPEKDDTFSQASDLPIWDGWSPYTDERNPNNMRDYNETHTYDPGKLTVEDIKWTDRCRCLGFNPAARGVTKTFIPGRGRYDNYGSFYVKKLGRDPNDTGNDSLSCFHAFDANDTMAFPFHEACFAILSRCLGYEDVKDIDKDLLYDVLASDTVDYGGRLGLDYGLVQSCHQFWDCLPGEEYSVCDPGSAPGIEKTLEGILPASLFAIASPRPGLAHKVHYDPLSVLPYDILHGIVQNLSTPDMLSLLTASEHVLSSTRATEFWKHMIRTRIAPWLWEIKGLLASPTLSDTVDIKGLFLWLDYITEPKFGITGPLMGIANRKRIWTICQKNIQPLYQERLRDVAIPGPDDEEAQALLDSAVSLHMPIVMYPQPKENHTVSAQFFRSWDEASHKPYHFNTYWNDDGGLVGIAISFGFHQRVFGNADGKLGKQLHVEAGDAIREIQVNMREIDMLHEDHDLSRYGSALDLRPSRDVYIEGMTITLKSGRSKLIKRFDATKGVRAFVVLEGMHLIGLTGQIAANGVVSRLGLLQAFLPGQEPRVKPSYTSAQKMLWSPSATELALHNRPAHPIWSHPTYRINTLDTTYRYQDRFPPDMLANEVLLWADSPAPHRQPTRISCFQVIGGEVSNGKSTWEVMDIIGLRSYGECSSSVGNRGPVPCQSPAWRTVKNPSELDLHAHFKPDDEAQYSHFDIDGPGGERVIEVHVSAEFKALKLVTNRDRECYWGEEDRSNWRIMRAAEDELIVGLHCCFGRLEGWSWSAKMYSHWALSNLGVVTMKIDDEYMQ